MIGTLRDDALKGHLAGALELFLAIRLHVVRERGSRLDAAEQLFEHALAIDERARLEDRTVEMEDVEDIKEHVDRSAAWAHGNLERIEVACAFAVWNDDLSVQYEVIGRKQTHRSKGVISNWLTGKVRSTLVLPSLCRMLGCSIEWVLTGAEQQQAQ